MSDILNKLKQVVATVAPGIAAALGSPAAGAAVATLSNIFLGKPDGTPEEIYQQMQSIPAEKLLELKKAELDADVAHHGLEVQESAQQLADKNSARHLAESCRDPTTARLAYI